MSLRSQNNLRTNPNATVHKFFKQECLAEQKNTSLFLCEWCDVLLFQPATRPQSEFYEQIKNDMQETSLILRIWGDETQSKNNTLCRRSKALTSACMSLYWLTREFPSAVRIFGSSDPVICSAIRLHRDWPGHQGWFPSAHCMQMAI